MGHNISWEKGRRLEAEARAKHLANAARLLTVNESLGDGHGVVGQCECGRRCRVWPQVLRDRGLGERTWHTLLREQKLVCKSCGRGLRKLDVSLRPEPLLSIWRDA